MTTDKRKPGKPDIQGEGNYDAARDYDRETTRHAKDREAVRRQAEAARDALDRDKQGELEKAEAAGKARARK